MSLNNTLLVSILLFDEAISMFPIYKQLQYLKIVDWTYLQICANKNLLQLKNLIIFLIYLNVDLYNDFVLVFKNSKVLIIHS